MTADETKVKEEIRYQHHSHELIGTTNCLSLQESFRIASAESDMLALEERVASHHWSFMSILVEPGSISKIVAASFATRHTTACDVYNMMSRTELFLACAGLIPLACITDGAATNAKAQLKMCDAPQLTYGTPCPSLQLAEEIDVAVCCRSRFNPKWKFHWLFDFVHAGKGLRNNISNSKMSMRVEEEDRDDEEEEDGAACRNQGIILPRRYMLQHPITKKWAPIFWDVLAKVFSDRQLEAGYKALDPKLTYAIFSCVETNAGKMTAKWAMRFFSRAMQRCDEDSIAWLRGTTTAPPTQEALETAYSLEALRPVKQALDEWIDVMNGRDKAAENQFGYNGARIKMRVSWNNKKEIAIVRHLGNILEAGLQAIQGTEPFYFSIIYSRH